MTTIESSLTIIWFKLIPFHQIHCLLSDFLHKTSFSMTAILGRRGRGPHYQQRESQTRTCGFGDEEYRAASPSRYHSSSRPIPVKRDASTRCKPCEDRYAAEMYEMATWEMYTLITDYLDHHPEIACRSHQNKSGILKTTNMKNPIPEDSKEKRVLVNEMDENEALIFEMEL